MSYIKPKPGQITVIISQQSWACDLQESELDWTAMENISTLGFILPPYFSDNNTPTLFHPTYQTLKDIELRVLDIFHTNKISKRSVSDSRRQGRRYLVYDRPPKKKKEKKGKGKCPSSNGISALTFMNFAIGAVSLAANVVNSINSNNNNNNQNNNNNNNNIGNVNVGRCRYLPYPIFNYIFV